ncbi:MAG: GH36-type glycosyl hydrolase domain-containing protein [Polyangiaceae bacterium]
MTAAGIAATQENGTQSTALETEARALAETQQRIERAALIGRVFEPAPVARALEHAEKHLASRFSGDTTLPKAAEWFLDNYYLIRRVARQIAEELPRGFVRHLPRLASGPSKGIPRIDALARVIVVRSGIELDVPALRRFVETYQEVSPLTIAELWALPTMLRTCVLQHLLHFLDELEIPTRVRGGRGELAESLDLEPGAGVERSIRALRLLDAIDWKSFFAKTNRVEAILRNDPAGVYQRMDFETCDSYRKVVETLAWGTDRAEEDVADLAVALARDSAADERRGHVGYYLLGGGRPTLEAELGYRPFGLDRLRRTLTRWPTVSYLLPMALLTLAPLVITGCYLGRDGLHPFSIAMAMAVAALPASVVAVTMLQWAMARLLPPSSLPKLDFTKGLPEEARTLVVIPTLLGRAEDVEQMMRQVELHYLSNPDPRLRFALLTDDVDAKAMPESNALLESVAQRVASLNARHGKDGHGPFHLLHREPRWNPAEQRFMGWERKRGKLEELNRLLRGDTRTSYTRQVGDPEGLAGIRYVITLDSDTELPMGSAHRLIGLLAHPLNRAVFDAASGRVASGYTIVQPRIETSPSSSRQTRFSRLFAGDIGFDIYTHAVSELYQDLFGSGIYVGKGIYDIDAFMRSIEGRVPENSLVSHDLFEGVHGRTALATDIILFEGYPSNYATFAKRMHRWVRGDWQLLPWLFPKVPSANGARLPNKLAPIDRWKIVDNLRRSLTGPFLLLLLVLGWIWLPGSPLLWTLGALAILLAPIVPALARDNRMRLIALARWALAVSFLAHEASVVVDAIARVLVRMAITRKHLLQWTSAAHAAFGIDAKSPRRVFWRTMFGSPVLAAAAGMLVAWVRPSALVAAAPLLVAWLLAPEIARWVSQPLRSGAEQLGPAERRKLRLLARRTWRFFDAFVGPNDQWLPIDNYQEEPREQTAHRTSPTNIGLMLVSTLSAYDFGYIGPNELSLRIRRAFDSITRLSHYQGHLLNWYETKNLQPLLPRYVSTVDSGNFAGCLLALKQGCKEVASSPVVRAAVWRGLEDSIGLLEQVVAGLPKTSANSLLSVIARMQDLVTHGHDNLGDAHATLRTLCDDTSTELGRELLGFLETGAHRHEADVLRALRMAIDTLHQQLHQTLREVDTLLPWLSLRGEAAAQAIDLPTQLRLDEIPEASRRMRADLEVWVDGERRRQPLSSELEASAHRLDEAFRTADLNATTLRTELLALSARAEEEVRGMDFRLLYDVERKLFHIGYNATADQVDGHYYDLLASEARLASYLAIVKRDVPESHWYALGRPMTRVDGAPALLSWGGTMFEYLMPSLLMKSQQDTLLDRTGELAVVAQMAHAEQNDEPWGVSESAYARIDAHQTYQYRSFGVPGLGFKRGLENDRVVTPYASMLAVSLRPGAVVANLDRLESMGMLGAYGLFEALDLTPERVPEGRSFAVVRSYMAHHQGMLLVALGNYLNDHDMIQRFHSDPLVQTGELLLNEHAPHTAPPEWPVGEGAESAGALEIAPTPRAPGPWSDGERGRPHAFVLSNGRMTSLLTDSGGGGLLWHGLALTRYQPDATRDDDGLWIYLRDEYTGSVWLATSAEGRTTYAMHKAEFHRRDEGISVHVDVAIAPADDVEVRQITLHNETGRARRLTVTSTGRPVLLDAKQAPTHPAFSSMFVESERVADLDALLFARRPQSAEEEPAVLVHRLVREGAAVVFAGYETDRSAFFGRCRSPATPLSLAVERGALRGRVGAVLDPIMSLMARVDLKPRGSVTLAFVTTVSRSRSASLELARRYGSMHAVRWAFRDADQECARRLQRTDVEPALIPAIQRLFSALLFAEPTLRAPRDGLPAARPCKSRLWGRGISGDDPVLLVRVADPEAALVSEALAAQRYLRSCGVRIDLVLLDEQPSGYQSEGSGTLLRRLAQTEAADWLNRHGGIFVVATDTIADEERRHLEASARVVLDTRDGSLAHRMERASEGPPTLPRFEPTLVDEPPEPARPRPNLLFDNGTGGFTEDGREYVVSVRPGKPTPAPWCNVIANDEFGCLVSESSLGTTWSINSGENRLTPWRNDPVFDTPSEALYLRDEETAAVWSPTPLPAGRDGETLVRHGAGYTTYEKGSHGLEQEMTVFVPPDVPLKVVKLRVRNTLERHRRLTATYYAEWVLGSRREEQRPYIASEFDRGRACLLATCNWNAEFGERVAFLASRNKPHGFTTDRLEFLGRRGDYARPEALERWGLSGCVDAGVDPCAALQVHMELAPGEEVETHFVLGQARSRDEALALVTRFRDPAAVDAAWIGCRAFWDDVLGSVRVKTPEPAMDLMLNRWLVYQTLSARVFGRTAFYQSSGAFGYRDQLQDVMALFHAAPGRARAHILEAAAHQFAEGDVLHWWHPPSGRGVRTRCSDDMAWLPYVTAAYVAATGDVAVLREVVPFLAAEPLRPDEHDRYAHYETSGSATLLEHCRKALERAVTQGNHGLPLMGAGDWNDGMNRVGIEGRGESVWLGWFLCDVMDRFAGLCARIDDLAEASKWRATADALRRRIEACAWDGSWYLRAFHDDGSLIGSAKSRECRIDSIAQSWSVLGGGKDPSRERARAAMRAAEGQLVREADRLVLLSWPPFDGTLHDPGYIRAYPPGIRENGGQYTHAATWLGWAHAALGEGERATQIFRLLNPILRTRTAADAGRYRVEPYALAGDVYSCPPWVGRGGWTLYTGAAAWMWRLGTEALLGLHLEDGHLRIDPCIPPEWKGFEAWIRLGEERVHVVVENPDQVATGVASMTVDRTPLDSNLLRLVPAPGAAGEREVHVRLGRALYLPGRGDRSAV